jgi:hypothetical protein
MQRKELKNDRVTMVVDTFDSVASFRRFVTDETTYRNPCQHNIKQSNRSRSKSGSPWVNFKTYKTIEQDLATLPQDLKRESQRMTKELSSLIEVPQKKRRKRRRGLDSGVEIDPYDATMRRTDAWEDVIKHPTATKHVSICIDVGVACGESKESSLYRGCMAVVLNNLLRSQGVSCSFCYMHRNFQLDTININRHYTYIVKCNDAGTCIDDDSLCYVVAEIGYTRLYNHLVKPRIVDGKVCEGLGFSRPQNFNHHAADKLLQDDLNFDVIIDNNVTTRYSAINFIKTTYARIVQKGL